MELLTMPTLFAIIKIVAIAQLLIVIVLFFSAYGIKLYFHYSAIHRIRLSHRIELLIDTIVENKLPVIEPLLPYRRYLLIIMNLIKKRDGQIDSMVIPRVDTKHEARGEPWPMIRQQIINLVLLPNVMTLSRSTHWYDRYIACQFFQWAFSYQEEESVILLIHDPVPLVSISAAIIAMNCNSQRLLDAVIDVFSKGRHVQQSLFAQIVSHADLTIIPLIHQRLRHEPDPYIKAFCYRTLTAIPMIANTIETAFMDSQSVIMELKLATLVYLNRNDPTSSKEICHRLINDEHWEIRAKAATLLGTLKDETSIPSLEHCLHDPEWWVRMNAAEALLALGPTGIIILSNQQIEQDRFAYETAQLVLSRKRPGPSWTT